MDDDENFQPEFSWRRAPVLLADQLGVRPAGLLGELLAEDPGPPASSDATSSSSSRSPVPNLIDAWLCTRA